MNVPIFPRRSKPPPSVPLSQVGEKDVPVPPVNIDVAMTSISAPSEAGETPDSTQKDDKRDCEHHVARSQKASIDACILTPAGSMYRVGPVRIRFTHETMSTSSRSGDMLHVTSQTKAKTTRHAPANQEVVRSCDTRRFAETHKSAMTVWSM